MPAPADHSAEAGAPETEIVITPEMIAAGVDAYLESTWENPDRRELEDRVRTIFLAMSARHHRVA